MTRHGVKSNRRSVVDQRRLCQAHRKDFGSHAGKQLRRLLGQVLIAYPIRLSWLEFETMFAKRILVAAALTLLLTAVPAWSQDDGGAAAREKSIADRFMQVLLRRPAPGTALDRVYGYHIQAGSLDDLFDGLQRDVEKGGEDAGAKAMLLGLMQLQRGRDADAAESLATAEQLRPEDAMASHYLGRSLVLVGRGEAAAEAWERAIDRKPARNEALPVFTKLGRLYGRSQQNEKALSVWTRLEERFPGDTRVGEQIAQTLAEEGQDEAALTRFETLAEKTATSNDSRAIGFQIAAAELKRKIGRSDEALADLESILARLRPSSWLHSDVQRRIEAGFLRSGDYNALADYYAQQVKEQPDALELRMRLGRVQSKAGLLVDAEKTLRACVELAPTQSEPRLALVDLMQATGKYADAAVELRELVQQDPENPDYLIRLGNTILEDGEQPKETRYAEAATVWQQLADARRDDAVVTAQVGDLMRRIDRTDDAIKLYRRAIELQPEQPQYREYLGEFLNRLGRKGEAMEAWGSIVEGDRDTRENYIRLAEVLHTFDHPEPALDAFTQAANMDPTFAQRLRFTDLLLNAARYDDALAQLDAAERDAESPEEREQLLRARIGVYATSGKLDERIAEAREQAGKAQSAEAYRRLALLLDAGSQTDESVVAIELAMTADPSDIGSMEVAAELYRRTSRSTDAIGVYRRLAEVDTRFLPNYLKRISSLHMELGQVDESLAAADELIQAGPGNPESYRFYATQCFRVGRDDEGIERLRRALRAAPRDRDAQRALASALDERFRTDEAIELYWALLEDTDDLSEQRGFVKSLAELYGRKGDFDRLLGRLELRGREASDMRTATLLISEAHRSMDDLGAASAALEPLLAENPRDAELIGQLVDLATAADDLEMALQYQEQLTKLADTPENRNGEMRLLISIGQMDRVEAMLQRMKGVTDPLDLIDTIDRSIGKQELTAAQQFCELTLEKYPELWEVRARLASLLIVNDELDRAEAEIEAIAALDLPDDTVSEKHKDELAKARARGNSQSTSQSLQIPSYTKWFSRMQNIVALDYFFKLGRYANVNFGYASLARSAVDPDDVAHAKLYADALRMVVAEKRSALDTFVKKERLNDTEFIESMDDPKKIRRLLLYLILLNDFSRNPADQADAAGKMEKFYWRMMESSADTDLKPIAFWLLESRARRRSPDGVTASNVQLDTLSQRRVAALASAFDRKTAADFAAHRPRREGFLAAALYAEMQASGMADQAAVFLESLDVDVDSIASASTALGIAIGFKDLPRVTAVLDRLVAEFATWSKSATSEQFRNLHVMISDLGSLTELEQNDVMKMVDITCALQVVMDQNQRSARNRTHRLSKNAGTINTGYERDGNFHQLKFEVPLTDDARLSELILIFSRSGFLNPKSPYRDRLQAHWTNGQAVLADRPELAKQEMLRRRTIMAYSHWWSGNPEKTYEAVVALSEDDPENKGWWIERARLAAELKMPETSLEALDSITPMDQATLQIRELAAMNLASQLGDLERAKTAAQRLFGMRLDKDTELALADQLTRLGMREMSAAILQRSRRRGGQSISDLLSLADRYVAADDKEAAAEVAYSAMRKLGRGGERNEDYYRRRAVELLRKAGRLDSIITQAESRVQSSPDSLSLKSELASLYTAAGRTKDAGKIFDEIATLEPDDPKTMWSAAERLTAAGKHDEAIIKFVAAAVKDPTVLNNGYYRLTNCLRQCKSREKAYEGLMQLKLEGLQSHIIGQLASSTMQGRRGGDDELSKFEEAFLDKVLTEGPIDSFANVLRSLVGNSAQIKSKTVVDTVRRIFKAFEFYDPSSLVWRQASLGSDGHLYGIVEPCMIIIHENDELKKEIQALLEKKADSENGSPIAELMLIAINVRDGVSNATASKLKELRQKRVDEIPYHLWWQFGQLIEENQSWIDSGEVVDVFEKARDVSDASRGMLRQFQHTSGPRLADAYVRAGRKAKAKRELLKAYENTNNSEQNQNNPGYGDSQDLDAFKSIADKLVESGSRISAIPIYADALSQPERFELAARWGGSRNRKEAFEKALDETLGALTDEDFDEFLSLSDVSADAAPEKNVEEVAEGDSNASTKRNVKKKANGSAIELLPLAATAEVEPMNSSVAAIVASKMSETDEGREKLAAFEKLADERLRQSPDDASLVGALAIVSTLLNEDSAPERFARLTELIPAAETGKKRQAADDTIMGLYSPILVGLSAGDEATRKSALAAADQLASLADVVERSAVSETLLLGKIKYAGGSASSDQAKLAMLLAMLDRAAPASSPPKVIGAEAAEACVRVAETAVKAEAWSVAIDAIGRALGGGPPLRTIGDAAKSGSTFLPQASQSTSNQEPTDNQLDGLARRTTEVLKQCQTAMENDSKLAQTAYNALVNVVMPPQRATEIFPYLTKLIAGESNNPFGNQGGELDTDPGSVSRQLAVAAKASGQTEALLSRLADRRVRIQHKPLADLIAVQIALVGDDADALDSAIDRMMSSVGIPDKIATPGKDDVQSDRAVDDAKSSREAQMSANALLHVLMPIHARDGMTPAAIRISRHVLGLAARDSQVSQSSQTWQWLIKELLSDEQVDDEQAGSLAELYLDGVRQRYARYSQDGLIEQQVAHHASQLVGPLTEAKRFGIAARYERQKLIDLQRRKYSFNDGLATLPIATADPEKQFEFLTTLMFGTTDQSSDESREQSRKFLLLNNWRWYAEPPEVLVSAAPNLIAARSQHVAAQDFPLESIGQSIAVAAAACGKTDELIDRLRALVEDPGDNADAVVGIALLTAGRIDEAGKVIDRVAKRLRETVPKKNVNTPMMNDSAALFVRAYEVDSLRDRVVRAWPSMQDQFRKHNIYRDAGYYNKVGARILPSHASGATVDPGLDHWVAYQMPYPPVPVNEAIAPTWIAKDETLSYGGGMDVNLMQLKYPLTGDFTFTVRQVKHPFHGFGVTAGGQSVQARAMYKTIKAQGLINRSHQVWKCEVAHVDRDNVYALRFEGDHVAFDVNGSASGQITRSGSFPFVGLFLQSNSTAEVADIAIEGNATIPRYVDLIGDELRGWSCPIHVGELPKMTLRTDPVEPETNQAPSDSPDPTLAWLAEQGVLKTGAQKRSSSPGECRHIQYQRPLLDGETITYEADYVADQTEVHPSIGRVVVMIRPSGVKLRWLVQTRSLESDKEAFDTEVDPDEVLVDGGIELTPSTKVAMTAEGDQCLVTVNGTPVCRFTMAFDRRPGFLCEKDREVRITSMQLTGDWPETVPDDLLEPNSEAR